MSSNTNEVTTSVSTERLIGRVKWFNNKVGYGFITITSGDKTGSDIFSHHSSIDVDNPQYKYLVQGEYVEFNLTKPSTGPHEFHAYNISGIKGGKLMCETRYEFKLARNDYKTTKTISIAPSEEVQSVSVIPKQKRVFKKNTDSIAPKSKGEGPRDGDKQWKLVSKKGQNYKKSNESVNKSSE